MSFRNEDGPALARRAVLIEARSGRVEPVGPHGSTSVGFIKHRPGFPVKRSTIGHAKEA